MTHGAPHLYDFRSTQAPAKHITGSLTGSAWPGKGMVEREYKRVIHAFKTDNEPNITIFPDDLTWVLKWG